jgi:BirA family transcriptional regulator, biotin operon repressor / biotin---[acetyl-CoA-carboxylase] ligase
LISAQNAVPFLLSDRAVVAGYRLRVFDKIDSTNDAAFRLAADDASRTWVVAREQTAGRGRHGRQWQSPPGNLYASLLLVDVVPQPRVPLLGFTAGVALAHAARRLVPDASHVQLKWPNDILFDGGKLAGILIEGRSLAGGRHGIVIGFGVNCQSRPENLPYRAVALAETGARQFEPEVVLTILSEQMAIWLDTLAQGFDAVRDAWLSLAAGLGQTIAVKTATRTVEGVFQSIDATGRLILTDRAGTHRIDAGDVILGH